MKKYWILQLAGWLGYSAAGVTINLMAGAHLLPLLIGHALLVSCGIGFTHLLRREIHRRRLPNEPVSRLWPMLALGSLGISAVLASLVVAVNSLLTGAHWDLISKVALWWGMLLAVGVWSILYVRFSERRQHEIREGQLQLSLRESRLLALEAQINPHFLFNALNSIRALVEIEPARAQEMVTRLSNVLRNSLRRDDEHTVPLGSELEAVSDYLALESVRYPDRLYSSVVADSGLASCLVPPMVLQTLVENAVKHGVAPARGRADLLIQASADGENLLIAVKNTGRLTGLRGQTAGVGLQNVRERLKLLYGDRAALQLREEGGSVVATVAIPIGGDT